MSELRITADAPHGPEPHSPEWSDWLQDWLDGELDPPAKQRLDAHLESCGTCAAELMRLRDLDHRLAGHFVSITLDASFEERLLEDIRRIEAARLADTRAAARARIEQQDRQLTIALEQAWRRTKHALLAKLSATLAAALAMALVLAAACPGLDFAGCYPALVTAARQPVTLAFVAVVVAVLGLTVGLRRTQLT